MKLIIYKLNMIRWVAMLLFVVLTHGAYSQHKNSQIQLLDAQNNQPIIGAAYQYGDLKGISDANGIIEVSYQERNTLYLSHISYGQWQLSGKALQEAFSEGRILKEVSTINMQPVTIIGIKHNANQSDELSIQQPDRLAHDAGAILSRNPEISGIRKSGSYGFDPVLRGFKYDQLNLVIDGAQSATAACPNRMDPPTSQVAPNMMDHIEITKGPHSLRFGSAFGGTINFISVAPDFTSDGNLYGRISSTYESNGGIVRSEGKLGYKKHNYDLNLYGSWSQGNDYTDGEGISIPSGFLRGSFGANLGLAIAKNQKVIISATRNLARDTDFPALQMDLRSDDTWLMNSKHEINFEDKTLQSWQTTIYATMVDHVMDNFSKDLNPRMVDAETKATTQNYGGRTEGIWNYAKAIMYLGADYKVEQAEGNRTRRMIMGPMAGTTFTDNIWQNSKITKTGAFGEYHLPFGTTNFIFSGRIEINNAVAHDIAPEFNTANPDTEITQVNPSLSIGGVHNFNSGFYTGIWLGRAQRSGSITERYINFLPVGQDPYEMLGNPELKAEINNQADINLGFKSINTTISLSLFASLLQDYISSEIDPTLTPKMPTSPGVRRFVNVDKAFMTGFEITWNQRLIAGLSHQLSAAYTYGQNKVLDQPLPEIAPLDMRYVLSGSYLDGKLIPEIALRHVIQQDRIATAYGETSTPAFTLVDASVSYKPFNILSVTIGAQNIFDVAYYEHLSRSVPGTSPRPIYAPGRNLFVSLLVDLK